MDCISGLGKDIQNPIYIIIPKAIYSAPLSLRAPAAQASRMTSTARINRWAQLKDALDRKGKGKPDKSCDLYTSYPNVGWKDVQKVFNKYIVSYVQVSKCVPMDDLDLLFGCVRSVRKTFGSPTGYSWERSQATLFYCAHSGLRVPLADGC